MLIAASLRSSGVSLTMLKHNVAGLSVLSCLLIILAFVVNFLLVTLRNFCAYRLFNIEISFATTNKAQLAGQLGGVLPVFGSILSQAIHLKQAVELSSATSSFLYLYDKIIMALTGVMLSIVCALMLLHDWTPLQSLFTGANNTSPGEFILALLLCSIVVVVYAMPKNHLPKLLKLINVRTIYYVLTGVCLSICVWLISASCFVFGVKTLGADAVATIAAQDLFFASVIVSFIASMPVSVNGWGIREFAAITILAKVLVPAEIALSTSITIGVLSTLSLLVVGLFINILPKISIGRKVVSTK